MRLNIICFFNTVLNCFANPIFTDKEPDIEASNFRRSLIVADVKKCEEYKNTQLMNLGVFDDETGKFDLLDHPVELVNCNKILLDRGIEVKIPDDKA